MESIDVLSEISGRLVGVEALVYFQDGSEILEHPIELLFEFSNSTSFTIGCSKDGESVEIQNHRKKLSQKDMGEFGKFIVKDMINEYPWSKASGEEIVSVFKLQSGSIFLGVKLMFQCMVVVLLNLGDELYIFDRIPLDIFESEGIVTIEVDRLG